MMAWSVHGRSLCAVAVVLLLSGCLAPGDRLTPAVGGEVQAPVDLPPRAAFVIEGVARAGAPVRLDARASVDPENSTLRFAWDFGDGRNGTGAIVSHAYERVGVFMVVLNVTDGSNQSDVVGTSLQVQEPPPPKPKDLDAWSVEGSLLASNPLMERLGRPIPFVDEPWPVVGGDRLEDFQARSLGHGSDHRVYPVRLPTNGTRLQFVLEWEEVTNASVLESAVDLDLFVFDAAGRLLPDGFMAATGRSPETFVVTDPTNLTHGTYQVLVLLFRGIDVDFTVHATLSARPGSSSPTA